MRKPKGDPWQGVTSETGGNAKRNAGIPCAAADLTLLLPCYIYKERNIYIGRRGKPLLHARARIWVSKPATVTKSETTQSLQGIWAVTTGYLVTKTVTPYSPKTLMETDLLTPAMP